MTAHPVEPSTFREELQVRVAEAQAQLAAAEALGDDLTAGIAAADLADLRALAARGDVPLEEPHPAR